MRHGQKTLFCGILMLRLSQKSIFGGILISHIPDLNHQIAKSSFPKNYLPQSKRVVATRRCLQLLGTGKSSGITSLEVIVGTNIPSSVNSYP